MKQYEATLKELWIVGTDLIGRCLETSPWRRLEKLKLSGASISSIAISSKLPRLEEMEIYCPETSGVHALEQLAIPSLATPKAFPSLHSLLVTSVTPHHIQRILSHLPRDRKLRSLTWRLPWDGATIEDCQRFIDILEMHPDYFRLKHLVITCPSLTVYGSMEPVDVNPVRIDIQPLFGFEALETLVIDVPHNVLITPSVLKALPDVWPQLHRLVLAPSCSVSHPPTIDHTHILELAQRLPQLIELGIKFDASCVTGQERINGSPHKLQVLRVGRSPICSTTGVIAFLRSNFPRLEELDISCHAVPKDESIFKQRWEAVLEGWKNV
ncbi:hypothetical protein NMY22_g7531 [Coprinellus aureogranulatus]|nr:hypothetical protein NMY22_g7531 [Coprinellus aureogranulatus]